MEFIGTLITYLMMACCVVGGISYIVNDQSELGRAFQDGLHAMANMFIPICGLMASVPFLKVFISKVFGPVFALFGGDPVVAAAIIMPPDCGSFTLATEIGQSADLFPVIIAIGFMCASTIAFNVPIGLSMLEASLMQMDVGPLFGLFLQSFFIGITMRILSIVIFVIVYGRMIEIYCMVSLAPIPMATWGNHEQSHMGMNYLKCLFALGFQGFLILICVAIYAVLIQNVAISGDAIGSIWSIVGYTVLLCFSLFKTSSVTKSVLGAH